MSRRRAVDDNAKVALRSPARRTQFDERPQGRSQLIEFRDMLTEIRSKVARLKSQGRTQDEVLAAKPSASYDEKWRHLVPPNLFVRTVYAGV